MIENMQIIGLIYDAAGISILGLPAIFKFRKEIAAQSGTYYGSNPHMLKMLTTSRVDTTAGSLLLISGFLIQIVSLLDIVTTQTISIGLIVFLAVLFVSYVGFIRGRIAGSLARSIQEYELNQKS